MPQKWPIYHKTIRLSTWHTRIIRLKHRKIRLQLEKQNKWMKWQKSTQIYALFTAYNTQIKLPIEMIATK